MSEKNNPRSFLVPVLIGVLVLVLGVAGVFGYRAWRQAQEAARIAAAQEDVAAAIAEKLGIRVMKIIVTADGGLIDFRYQVLDPNKAALLFEEISVVPKMVAENGTIISLSDNPHAHNFQPGLTYFVLYRNVGDSIRPGSEVTVLIGDEFRLEHVAVEK